MRHTRTSRTLRAVAAVSGLSAASCFVTVDDSRLAKDAGSTGALSYMLGNAGGGESDGDIASFEGAFGRPLDVISDTLSVDAFQYGPFHSSNGRAVGKVFGVEMLSESFDGNQNLTDLQQAASGAYDAVYTNMAKAMASFGDPPVSVRIGNDVNGNWKPWSTYAGNTHNATPAAYVATFKRMAKIFRQYSPTTLVEWSLSLAPQGMLWPGTSTTPPDYWVGKYDPVSNPGGADVVSMSFFEAKAGSNFDSDIRASPWGLDWLASFAAQNGVKIALSDVATGVSNSPGANQGCPCSNDAAMMQHLVDWIASLPAGQFTHLVFAPWAPADDLLAPGNEAILAVWTKSWGSSYFAGSWWRGPAVPSQR